VNNIAMQHELNLDLNFIELNSNSTIVLKSNSIEEKRDANWWRKY